MREEWISARDAADAMWSGTKPMPVPNSITKRAAQGMVAARAVLLTKQGLGGKTETHDCSIPKEFWGGRSMIPDWRCGDFSAQVQQGGLEEEWWAFGVTFEPMGIAAMVQAAGGLTTLMPLPSLNNPTGGRPTATDWEAVMIELAGLLYEGTLRPDTQAMIERAIKDSLSAKGLNIGDTTARDHARPLYRRLTCKDEN